MAEITPEQARELLGSYERALAEPVDVAAANSARNRLGSRATDLARLVIAQDEQLAAVRALADSYAELAAEGVHELAPVVADLRRALKGDHG